MKEKKSIGRNDIGQSGKWAGFPGSYRSIIVADRTVLRPGDQFSINYLLTGYGTIRSGKLYFTSSADIIDSSSTLLYGLRQITSEYSEKDKKEIARQSGLEVDQIENEVLRKSTFKWGGVTHVIRNSAVVVKLDRGVYFNDRANGPSIFFDMFPRKSNDNNLGAPLIVSEIFTWDENNKLNPPFKYNLKIKKNVRPGNYIFKFVFTYFDGERYVSDTSELPIKIMNVYERHEKKINWIIFIAVIIGLFFTVISGIEPLKNLSANNKKQSVISIDKLNRLEDDKKGDATNSKDSAKSYYGRSKKTKAERKTKQKVKKKNKKS